MFGLRRLRQPSLSLHRLKQASLGLHRLTQASVGLHGFTDASYADADLVYTTSRPYCCELRRPLHMVPYFTTGGGTPTARQVPHPTIQATGDQELVTDHDQPVFMECDGC